MFPSKWLNFVGAAALLAVLAGPLARADLDPSEPGATEEGGSSPDSPLAEAVQPDPDDMPDADTSPEDSGSPPDDPPPPSGPDGPPPSGF